MATRDEIEDALACADCCDVVEDHLRHCEPDECGVVESYRRVMARVEAGDHADWRSPARSAMTVMMTAEPWMHEHHDHRVVHDDKPITLDDVMDQRPRSAPAREWMAHLARERLARLKAARTTPAATSTPVVVDRPDPPLWWEIDGPAGLVELHAELTVREVLRRGERLANINADSEALEWAAQREHGIDELQAARVLLWAASDWLEPDDVLDLVATAARRMGWSHLRARNLFATLLGPRNGTGESEQ